jgi:hypothetical protein
VGAAEAAPRIWRRCRSPSAIGWLPNDRRGLGDPMTVNASSVTLVGMIPPRVRATYATCPRLDHPDGHQIGGRRSRWTGGRRREIARSSPGHRRVIAGARGWHEARRRARDRCGAGRRVAPRGSHRSARAAWLRVHVARGAPCAVVARRQHEHRVVLAPARHRVARVRDRTPGSTRGCARPAFAVKPGASALWWMLGSARYASRWQL